MKKIICWFLAVIMCIGLSGCGAVEKNDEGFLTNLGKALDVTWKNEKQNDVVYKEHLRSLVNKELECLGSYTDYTFTDERLAELAKQYFEALDSQLEGLIYYDADHSTYSKIYTGQGYNQKVKALYYIQNEYGLTVSDNNVRTLSDYVASGERLLAIENLTTQPLVLENKGNTCEMVIENTTKYDLSDIRLIFNFKDKDGVIVYDSTDYIDAWASGAKFRTTLHTSNVGEFDSIVMCIEDNSSYALSSFVPVEYVNSMIIEIQSPELPMELSYGYRNRTYTSCIVDAFRYEISSWNDGLANVRLYFSGKKTYDKDGDNTNGNCRFAYKLLAEDGTVAASGTVHQSTIKTNEVFKDTDTHCGNIAPGKYTLILENDT